MKIQGYKIWIIVFVLAGVSACKKTTESSQETEEIKLEKLMAEIKELSDSRCENESDWRIRPIGSKPCGGPTGFIPYSSKIDTIAFIKKVNKYTADQNTYNKKWGMSSDCSIPQRPKKIVCENNKPKPVYE